MPIDKKELKKTLTGYLKVFEKVDLGLRGKNWFDDSWDTHIWLYPSNTMPEGVAIHLFKKHWFNEGKKVIHFECWLRHSDHKRQVAPIEFHFEAGRKVTGFSRDDFHDLFIEGAGQRVENWSNYDLHERHAGRPLMGRVPFTLESLEKILVTEFCRLKQLSPLVDQIIHQLS